MAVLRGRSLNGRPWLIGAAIVTPAPPPPVGTGGVDSYQTFRRDPAHWTGNPAGFSTTYNKGWGQVTFNIVPSAAASGATLMLRLRDGNPGGNPGTYSAPGTVVQPWMAVPGAPTSYATSGTLVGVSIPASLNFYIADFAFSSDLTKGVTVTNPFGTGYVIAAAGDSIAAGFITDYYYYGGTEAGSFPSIATAIGGAIDPKARVFAPTNASFNSANPTLDVPGTGLWDVVHDAAGGLYSSPFPAAFLPALMAKLGVLCALTGWCGVGRNIRDYDPDVSNTTFNSAFKPVLAHSNYNVDALLWSEHNTSSADMNFGEYSSRLRTIVQTLQDLGSTGIALYACSVPLGGFGGSGPGVWTDNGNTALDFSCYRATKAFPKSDVIRSRRAQLYPRDYVNYHSSLITRADWGYSLARLIGDRVAGVVNDPDIISATRSGAVITINVARPLGTKLTAWRSMQPSTASWSNAQIAASDGSAMSNADSVEFANLFCIYARDTGGQPLSPVPTTPAKNLPFSATMPFQFSGPNTIIITLAADPGAGVATELHYTVGDGWGMNAATLGYPSIRDDSVDVGIPYGRELRRKIDAIYIPAPGAATTLTLAGVAGAASGVTVAPSAVCVASGLFGGVQPTGIDFQIDGGAWVAGLAALDPAGITPFGAWQASFISPSGLGAHTVSARMTGTTTPVAGPFSFTVAASDLPLSSTGLAAIRLDMDPRRTSLFYADTARTAAAADGSRVFGMTDATGSGNHLTNPSPAAMHFVLDHQNGLPALQGSAVYYDARYLTPATNIMGLRTVAGAALAGSLRGADFTILAVFKNTSGGGTVFSAGEWRDYSPQTLLVGLGGSASGAYAERKTAAATAEFVADTASASNVLRKVLVRFQASTGTLKLKVSGGVEQSVTTGSDYTTGAVWNTCTIGHNLIGAQSDSWGGSLQRLAVLAGYYATDAEATALLAYADRLYGAR